MNTFPGTKSMLATATATAILSFAGCGGGGDDGGTAPPPSAPPPASTSVDLRGLVAPSGQDTGYAPTDRVYLYDSTGASRNVALGADRRFTFSNIGSLRAPLLITTADAQGTSYGIIAVIRTLPAASTDVYVSAVSTAVAAAALGQPAAQFVASPSQAAAQLTAANIDAGLSNVRTTVGQIVDLLGGNSASFDPALSQQALPLELILNSAGQDAQGNTRFINGNALLPADRGVNFQPSGTALPAAVIADAGIALPLRAALTECFKLAVADRVTLDSAGNISALKGACATMPVAADYSNSLSSFAVRYGTWLLDERTRNAGFVVFPFALASNDVAVVNIGMQRSDRFFDSRFDTMARMAPGGADWHLRGNQRKYETFVQQEFSRTIHLNPPPAGATSIFGFSRIVSGLHFRFDPTNGADAANVRAIRITGRGLPAAGLVMTRSTSCDRASRFVLANKTGNVSVSSSANRSSTFLLQAIPAQTGAPLGPWTPNSTEFADAPLTAAQFAEMGFLEPYLIEVFKVTDTTVPSETVTVRTGDRPREAVFAIGFGWTQPAGQTLEYLNPAGARAGATPTINLAWTVPVPAAGQAPNSEPENVYAATRGTIGGVANTRVSDSVSFLPGARTSVDFVSNNVPLGETIPCTASAFPALTTTPNDFRFLGTFINHNGIRYLNEHAWQSF